MCDFADIALPEATTPSDGSGKGKKRDAEGSEREYLKIYETVPCRMLHAYGIAKYLKLSDETVWASMSEPLKTGSTYMTEYASEDASRRGVAINRWLQPLVDY